mmetsp:Transcript_33133/g.55517  ORF Transcript_33133/g.55517 Transcript_33133/m.55517 type:complete len:342 (-) Transcript_33133:806-1831(-)|eukprot:CAMPEP_0198207328 /NCGR_PEP_ID=MMETSP1445-20131203/10786_1 /TAXON_ID=36898 /ORGANISM="Pyramimonas sp., Strain CCMP2087" /LENGTH=341 /DNA_ID=CAMNT_0043880313 /DNA_START=353 /DNA_END=1378 /DNA_ORIENTATION=-
MAPAWLYARACSRDGSGTASGSRTAFAPSVSESNVKVITDLPYRTERQFLAGAGAGALTKTSVAPMERLKVIYQTAGMRNCTKYDGIANALRIILKEEGVKGFYKGNGANCFRVIPVYAIKFSLNDRFKEIMVEKRKAAGQSLTLGFWDKIAAGSLAGTLQILATYPLDLIRTRLQLAEIAGKGYAGIMDCGTTTFRTEGTRGLYKGMMPSMLAGVPYVGLQMTFYDMLKTRWAPYLPQKEDGSVAMSGMLVCGSVAGLTAQTLTFPTDTVRHRMQANGSGGQKNVYVNTADCFRKILVKEGVKGFFKGYGLNVVRSLPGAAVQFTSYDLFKTFLGLPPML